SAPCASPAGAASPSSRRTCSGKCRGWPPSLNGERGDPETQLLVRSPFVVIHEQLERIASPPIVARVDPVRVPVDRFLHEVEQARHRRIPRALFLDRKSTRLNSSHVKI